MTEFGFGLLFTILVAVVFEFGDSIIKLIKARAALWEAQAEAIRTRSENEID